MQQSEEGVSIKDTARGLDKAQTLFEGLGIQRSMASVPSK